MRSLPLLSLRPFRSYIHIRPFLCIIRSPSGSSTPSSTSFSVLRSPLPSRMLSPLTEMSFSFSLAVSPFRELDIMLVSIAV